MELTLDGESLELETLWKAARTALTPGSRLKIAFSKEAEARITRAEEYVKNLAESGRTVYGLNTGFGFFARTRIAPEMIEKLQHNIILSHACGVGEELPRDLVMAMWLILVNSICRGRRGLALEKTRTIAKTLEAGMLACVPARGSVGASGDLAPTAHAVLALLGEGECTLPGKEGFERTSSASGLKKLGLAPLRLGPKEGLCLINGTQLTAAMAVRLWNETKQLLAVANLTEAMMIEALRGSHHIVDRELLEEHGHKGTLACGREIAEWLGGHTEIAKSHADCDRVQDPYSLRCAPQVHGTVWEELHQTREVLLPEINATTDNPILFPEKDLVLHGGNFHAIYPARVCDRLAMAMATLANISERRINMAMKQDKSGLPNFLIHEGGLNSGFMMIQTTAAALVSECKTLSFPASVDSIPTNNDQEDHVSMGPIAGLKALQVAKNARYVLAIELLVAAQGLDMLAPLKSSPRIEAVKKKLRAAVPYLDKDRAIAPDVEKVAAMIERGEVA